MQTLFQKLNTLLIKLALNIALLSLIMAVPTSAAKVKISVLYIHYSVGGQMIAAGCHIIDRLDTVTAVHQLDTARIVFREYQMNNEYLGNPLSDTVHNNCTEIRLDGTDYDLNDPINRVMIWNSWDGVQAQYAGLLRNLFEVSDKENQPFWQFLVQHEVPGGGGGMVSEKYDLVIIKNPYACWFGMDPDQADSITKFYKALRDSVSNHPEINMAFAFGTPLRLGHEVNDSAQAKMTYDMASWFASDNFFKHTNSGPFKNVWKWDSYRYLCEASEIENRYCLKSEYQEPGDPSSHLSDLASEISQDSLVAFIKRASIDILVQKAGVNPPSRMEIDQKIKHFQDGTATLQEVQGLIKQYNENGN